MSSVSIENERRVSQGDTLSLYGNEARVYDAFYRWKDYAAESSTVAEIIRDREPDAETLLDVACGTGQHLEHLSERFEVEGLDLSSDMLAIARARLPDVPLHEGNMCDFSLDKKFDAVTCLFSSIGYASSTDDLAHAARCMSDHLVDGGVLVVEPWITPDVFIDPHIAAHYVDEDDLKIARLCHSTRTGKTSRLHFHYLVGTAEEGVRSFEAVEELTLFEHEDYVAALRSADLDVSFDDEGLMGRGLYVGIKH